MAKAIDSFESKDKAELNFSMTENIMKIEFDFPASILTAALEKLLTGIQNSDGTGTGDTDTPVITFEDFVGTGAGMKKTRCEEIIDEIEKKVKEMLEEYLLGK